MSTVLHRNPARAEANGDYEFTETRHISRIQVYRANSGNPGTVSVADTDNGDTYSFSAACGGVSEPNLRRGWEEASSPMQQTRDWESVTFQHFTVSGLLAEDYVDVCWTQIP